MDRSIGIGIATIFGRQAIVKPKLRRLAMQVELYCPHCSCHFAASPDTPAAEVLDRMSEDGPWYALGDGETFEDMIFAALLGRGAIRCPECGDPVTVSEESLGQFTREVLTRW
jgi:hypothetical protein